MEKTYQETIDYIAKRDGLDLIVNELKGCGFDPQIEQTGGFCLVVGVYGLDGFIWANSECVYFYKGNAEEYEGEEGELLLLREDETDEDWAVNVRRIYIGGARKMGALVGTVKFLWAEINKNARTLANFYELREEVEHRTEKAYTSRDFLVSLSRWNGWELSEPAEFIASINESAEMGRN